VGCALFVGVLVRDELGPLQSREAILGGAGESLVGFRLVEARARLCNVACACVRLA
jgi:hypothetical protein